MTDVKTAARQVLADLPEQPASQDERARATLRILLAAEARGSTRSVKENPLACPNCDSTTVSIRSPYCSVECRERSAFVRQFRAALLHGNVTVDRQVALGQALWHLLGGGRPLRRALIPERVIRQVIGRHGGRCAHCGASATGVDHIGTACNRPINLTAVCSACTRTRPFGDVNITERPDVRTLAAELAARVLNTHSLRPCDDPDTWDWRAFLERRRKSLGV